jgi:DNA-binding transcriptional LysR family regulator
MQNAGAADAVVATRGFDFRNARRKRLMPVDWNDLSYLLALHRKGSLAAAAKALGVTKATMSRRLSALEASLDARLFERKPNGMELTAAGKAAILSAEEMETALAGLETRIADATEMHPRGTVRLTAPHWIAALYLIPTLPRLKAKYAALDVQLVGTNVILNLAQREADVALRNVKPTHASLVSRKAGELGGCVYASPLYLERKGTPRRRDSLADHDVLAYADMGGMPGFEWMSDAGTHGGSIAFRANDPEALISAASAGLGLAAVPCLLGDRAGGVVRVPSLGFSTCDLFLVTHERIKSSPRVRVTTDFVLDVMRENRAEILGLR